jgi:hypothetical protein
MIIGLNRREKSATDGSEGPETGGGGGDGGGKYEWVEKTHETLGISTSYQAKTNGLCWDGARKFDVATHLSHLSHRGYGSANSKSYVRTCGILFFNLVQYA